MSGAKGVVLEKNNNKITVLTTEGAFQTHKYTGNVEIGEEILLPRPRQVPRWRIGASIAAVFLLVFVGAFGWNAFQPPTAVAMISVDINPSLQLTLDRKGKVLELESLNSEAEQLLSGLSFKGRAWDEALNEIIKRSVSMQYLTEEQDWVLVGYSPLESGKQLPAGVICSEVITRKVQKAVREQGLKPAVAVYELTSEEKVQAQATGLTLGEYALVDTAQKAGLAVKPEAVKEKEERFRLLETPEIQEQMKKDKRVKKISPKDNKDKGSNSYEYELMGVDKYWENKNNQGKKDKQKPGNSERDKDNYKVDRDNEKSRGSQGSNQGNDRGQDKSKDKVTDRKEKDNKGNNSDNNSNSNGQVKGKGQDKNNSQNNDNNKDKVNEQSKKDNLDKKSKSNQSNQNGKYNWDFRTVFRLSLLQRG